MATESTRADGVRLTSGGTEIVHLADLGTIPGVVIEQVAGLCGSGVARLRCLDGAGVQFMAPGSTNWGTAVTPDLDGVYLLEDGAGADKWCRVTIYTDDLAAGSEAAVTLADVYDNPVVDDDVTSGEAAAGATLTHTVSIDNDSGLTAYKLAVWIEAGGGIDEISDDGVAWVSPTTEAAALSFGDVADAASVTLHIKRTIGAGASADPRVAAALRCRWYQ